MPKIFRERVYFDLREAAAQMGVSFAIVARWAWEGEHRLNEVVEVFRDGDKLYISQASLRRVVGSELRWSEKMTADSAVVPRALPVSNFASCFISYSTKDQQFAERLYKDLLSHGIRCWFAPHSVQGGKKLNEQISIAIQNHDRLLLILSEHSIRSEWVKTEIGKARQNERKNGCKMLFPIRLVAFEVLQSWECFDATSGTDLASEIRDYYIPDFGKWKDQDAYQEAFGGLLRDLQRTGTTN